MNRPTIQATSNIDSGTGGPPVIRRPSSLRPQFAPPPLKRRASVFPSYLRLSAFICGSLFCASLACGADVIDVERGETTVSATRPARLSLDAAIAGLKTYRLGESRAAMHSLDAIARETAGKPEDRSKLVKSLAGLVASPESTSEGKAIACRLLALTGSDDVIPTLAPLLLDPGLADYARLALEQIPTPAALAALREALPKAPAKAKVGIIATLGLRRDAAAVEPLAAVLNEALAADAPLAAAAAAGLGRIGGIQASNALMTAAERAPAVVKPLLADAQLVCAETLIAAGQGADAAGVYQRIYEAADLPAPQRVAALRGLVRTADIKVIPILSAALAKGGPEALAAAPLVAELSGAAGTEAAVKQLPSLAPPVQAAVLDALANKGDRVAAPAALAAATSADPAVRAAALRALGRLGDASAVPVLVEAAATPNPAQDAARSSLDLLSDPGTDAALMKLAADAPPATKAEIFRRLAGRNAVAAVPLLLAAAQDADATLRAAAFKSLGTLARAEDVPALLTLVKRPPAAEDIDAAESALAAACGKVTPPDQRAQLVLKDLPGASPAVRASLVRVLGLVGSDAALAALRTAAKDADPAVQDAAVRALAETVEPAAAADLLDIIKSATTEKHRVLAMRGYARWASSPDRKPADRLAMCKQALPLAKTPQEQRLILAALATIKTAASLAEVAPFLEKGPLVQEACGAAVAIATPLKPTPQVTATIAKVAEVAKDATTKKAANEILEKAKKPAP